MMRTKRPPLFLLVVPFISLALTDLSYSKSGKGLHGLPAYGPASSARVDAGALYAQAPIDTYMLAQFEFEGPSGADPQGWYGVDRTAQQGTFFHVDDFSVINGMHSLWCGAKASSSPYFCSFTTLPGYGNLWDQYFESRDFQVSGDATLSFYYAYDSEFGYDYAYVDYSTDGGTTWNNVQTFTGTGSGFLDHFLVSGADSLKIRFHFVSDPSWSDEDGYYDSQGALIIDNIEIADGSGTVDFQDFEGESIGDTITQDGDWVGYSASAYGDFSGLFLGLGVLQEEQCERNVSYLWGFFSGSTYDYSCAGHEEQNVVPYRNERGQYINNEIWSPWIDLNPGGAVPPTATETILEFWKYQKGMVLNSLMFPTWYVRSLVDGCPTQWVGYNIITYGPVVPVVWSRWIVGQFIEPGATHLQIALGVMDMCPYWCGIYGTGGCHGHAPLYDHVKLYKLDFKGPVWSVRDMDLFQDNFPTDGSLTGTVRCDMALDTAPGGSPNIIPGDSVVMVVSDPTYGLGLDPTHGKAAVYIHVRSTGGQNGDALSGDLSRWPVVSAGGGWTKILMDTVYSGTGAPVPDQFCVDLNDNLFTPPDRIDFYFSAINANGVGTYWSKEVGAASSEAAVQGSPMEMQCLPTGNSDILYVDDFDGWGAEPYFDTAFDMLQIAPDRFDVRAPSAMMGNGLGSRASSSQIVDVYHIIIWGSGTLSLGTIADGLDSGDKSPDAGLLFDFLDQSAAWNPGLYISGDGVATEMLGSSPGYTTLRTSYISYDAAWDHGALGLPVSPQVVGSLPGTIFQDGGVAHRLVAYGGCPRVNDFDVLYPQGIASLEMYYDPDPSAGAVISQAATNAQGKTARVVLSGFSFHFIRDDKAQFPPDRVEHLERILAFMEGPPMTATGGGNMELANRLEQNYPNPFNPTTTIRFTLAENGHVTLKVYNVRGELVRTLTDGFLEAGPHNVGWNGRNDDGERVASGVYLYRLVAGSFRETKKMVLMK